MRFKLLGNMLNGIQLFVDVGPSGLFSKRPIVKSNIHCSLAVHRPATATRLSARLPRLADAACDIMADEAEMRESEGAKRTPVA